MEKLFVVFAKALVAKNQFEFTEQNAEELGARAYVLAGAAYRGTQGKKRKKDAKGEREKSAQAKRGTGRDVQEATRRSRHDVREEKATRDR